LFQRKVIGKKQYREFWDGYWGNKRSRDKERYIDKFVSELQLELPIKERTTGTITRSIEHAKQQAKEIGGYVIRRNKRGKFSKRGQFYQAVKRRKHGSKKA
jgi:hypothetical protein